MRTKAEMLDCLDREIRYRLRVYPGWVARGRMTAKFADEQVITMRAAREALAAHVPDDGSEPEQKELFG